MADEVSPGADVAGVVEAEDQDPYSATVEEVPGATVDAETEASTPGEDASVLESITVPTDMTAMTTVTIIANAPTTNHQVKPSTRRNRPNPAIKTPLTVTSRPRSF